MKNLKEIFIKDTIVDFKWKDKFYEKALKDGDIDRDFVDSASLKVVKDIQDESYNDGYIAGAATVGSGVCRLSGQERQAGGAAQSDGAIRGLRLQCQARHGAQVTFRTRSRSRSHPHRESIQRSDRDGAGQKPESYRDGQ